MPSFDWSAVEHLGSVSAKDTKWRNRWGNTGRRKSKNEMSIMGNIDGGVRSLNIMIVNHVAIWPPTEAMLIGERTKMKMKSSEISITIEMRTINFHSIGSDSNWWWFIKISYFVVENTSHNLRTRPRPRGLRFECFYIGHFICYPFTPHAEQQWDCHSADRGHGYCETLSIGERKRRLLLDVK